MITTAAWAAAPEFPAKSSPASPGAIHYGYVDGDSTRWAGLRWARHYRGRCETDYFAITSSINQVRRVQVGGVSKRIENYFPPHEARG